MNRATALKVFAAGLVVVLMLSAYPVADIVVRNVSRDDAAAATLRTAEGSLASGDALELPFGASPDADSSGSGATVATPSNDGSSSRPGSHPSSSTPAATGSAVLDQVIGASRLLGHDVQVPELPVHKLAAQDPLRHAILAWIAATGSVVPPDELARELARADALPDDLERDIALLVLSATEATLLQRSALAALSAEELAWIQAHPDAAQDLVEGITTPETLALAELAAKVDNAKSIQAALLLLEAVEATRGSLQAASASAAAASDLPVDPATRAILERLSATPGATDAEKIAFAADLAALGAGIPASRAPVVAVDFGHALAALLAETAQPVALDALADVLTRADALPDDLEGALGALLAAQARAIAASRDPTPEGQASALVGVLDAAAFAAPVLSKYNLYWTHVPEALRIGTWDPAVRGAWATQSAAYLLAARADPAETARMAAFATDLPLVDAQVPARAFVPALEALALEHGVVLAEADRANAAQAAATLEPAVRDAAAVLMSGAAESMRLTRLAYADLSDAERAELLAAPGSVSDARLAELAARIDRESLSAAGLVGTRAALDAREILAGAGAFAAQGEAEPVATGWRAFFAKLLPFGSARAQAVGECTPTSFGFGLVSFETDCARDILLRVSYLPLDPVNSDLLVISGTRGSIITPSTRDYFFTECPGEPKDRFGVAPSCFAPVPVVGSSRVHLDLGGDDTYRLPVASTLPAPLTTMVAPAQETLVSLHVDVGGNDSYVDPTSDVSTNPIYHAFFGEGNPHPTQASTFGGGVAILLDVSGSDSYESPPRSQAYGRYGFAALLDLTGSDEYLGASFTQGASSEALNVGTALLFDREGDDAYFADTGQGFGLGAVFVDLSGDDDYAQPVTPLGVPVVELAVLPGGNLTTLDERADDRFWLDGPDGYNVGFALDQEIGQQGTDDYDGDRFFDGVEELFGSDPKNFSSTPVEGTTARVEAVRGDGDEDGWSDAIERLLSTDPEDESEYPAGLPRDAPANGGLPSGGDKILDLRIPVQDAGSIDPTSSCTTRNLNGTAPYAPQQLRILESFFPIGLGTERTSVVNESTVDDVPRCVILGYDADGEGSGVVTFTTRSSGDNWGNYTYQLPAGIFALGDVTNTRFDVDYFVLVDLGGNDKFLNAAGGALPVATKPRSASETGGVNVQQARDGVGVLSPALSISVDQSGVDEYNSSVDGGARGNAHGALLGVLIDTAGTDRYVSGDASQGSQGGVLLDLGGRDVYTAGDLSQGAGLSVVPSKGDVVAGLPDGGKSPASDAFARRSAPGMLLDYGADSDTYVASSHSQGVGRGFPARAPTSANDATSVYATGILYNEGGSDTYAIRRGSVNTQGVGGTHATGILFDRAGGDTYVASDVVSQGSIVSHNVTQPIESSTVPRDPGYGILLDHGGVDTYTTFIRETGRTLVRTDDRQDRLTLTSAKPQTAGNEAVTVGARVERGIHHDAEQGGFAFVAGDADPRCEDPVPSNAAPCGYFLRMPSARLAIGDANRTAYDQDFALVVDFGGDNWYNHTAGGVVREMILDVGTFAPNNQVVNPSQAGVSLFPVSLLVDAGPDASSMYNASRALSQAAGYFGVGLVADLGGDDVFLLRGEILPQFASSWIPSPPVLDGSITDGDWKGIAAEPIPLVALGDGRFVRSATVRIANDENNLYFGFVVPTVAKNDSRLDGRLIVGLDSFHDRSAQARDGSVGVDGFEIAFIDDRVCSAADTMSNTVGTGMLEDTGGASDVRVGCLVDGDKLLIEVQKPIRHTSDSDAGDIAIRYDRTIGLTSRELGLRVEFNEQPIEANATSSRYVWPAGTSIADGQNGYRLDGSLTDELADWGALGLVNSSSGERFLPNATRRSALAQGAGVAGVGILAMLGGAGSDATLLAGERAQGYGAYGGLGLVVDAGGADRYEGVRLVQASAETRGLGAIVELAGNDNYVSGGESLGYSLAQSAGLFFDLEGADEYTTAGVHAAPLQASGTHDDVPSIDDDEGVHTERVLDTNDAGDYPPGNQRVWVRGADARGPAFGIDTNSQSILLETGAVLQGSTYPRATTELSIRKASATGACLPDNPRVDVDDQAGAPRDVLQGIVCLVATTTLSGQQQSAFTVSGIDFLVDGKRVPASPEFQVPGDWAFAYVAFDSRIVDDGMRQVEAVATVSSVEGGVAAFRSHGGAALRDVKVDNRPEVSLDAGPERSIGGSDAAFSPDSALYARELTLNWTVSHDAGEDRLELYQGWTPGESSAEDDLSGRNARCYAGFEALCNVLPFYFTADGELSTHRGTNAIPERKIEQEGAGSYTGQTNVLDTHLDVLKDDAFRVVLHNRQAIVAGTYTTPVKVVLLDDKGQPAVIPGTTTPVVLASRNFTSTQSTGVAASTAFLAATSSSGATPDAFAALRALCDATPGCSLPEADLDGIGAPRSTAGSGPGNPWDELVLDIESVPDVPFVEDLGDRIRIADGYALRVVVDMAPGSNPARDAYRSATMGTPAYNPNADALLRALDAASRFEYGSRDAPSRLEVLTPTEPTTAATVIVQRVDDPANFTYVLSPSALYEGDVVGTLTDADGLRTTQRQNATSGTIGATTLPDGLYRAYVNATDGAGGVASANATFFLDARAPRTLIATPDYVGAPLLESGGRIPVEWAFLDEIDANSSGIKETYLWFRDYENNVQWTPAPKSRFLGTESSYALPASNARTKMYDLITVAVDEVGNVEGIDAPRATFEETLTAARDLKAATPGGFKTVRVDEKGPQLLAPGLIEGGNALVYRGRDVTFVRPGDPVTFSVRAHDPEGAITLVNVVYIPESDVTAAISRTLCGGEIGGCGGDFFADGAFGALARDDAARFPDGLYTIQFEIYDQGKNVVKPIVGAVLLDSTPPTLTLEAPVYPAGQGALKRDDRVALRFHLTDAYGIDPDTLVIDASAISTAGVVKPVETRLYYEAVVRADKPNLLDGSFQLPIRARDFAGNLREGFFEVVVDTKQFAFVPGSFRVTDVSYDNITVAWNTTEPASSQVRFGTAPLELSQRSDRGAAFVTEHSVTIDGLDSVTRYYLRPVSSSIGGFTLEGDTIEAETPTALHLRGVSPAAGSAVSGAVPVAFEGILLGSDDFVTYTVEARSNASTNYSFVTTSTERGMSHELVFNSSRYLDGDAYMLRIVAKAGRELKTAELGPFTSDNTAPVATIVTPIDATNDTTPRVVVEVRDNLAGFGTDDVELLVDGEPVPSLGLERTASAITVKHDLAATLDPGVHAFELRLRDRAGNALVEAWNVTVDGDLPVVDVGPTAYEPGPDAARAGGLATLNVTIEDAGGIRSVVADTSEVSSQRSTLLFQVTGTDRWTGTFPVTSAAPAETARVRVVATDLAGNAQAAEAVVVIDNEPPQVGEFSVRDAAHTRVVLGTTSLEPVRLVGTAKAANAPEASAESDALSTEPRLVLTGLLPSRTYSFTVKALDRAGNAVEAAGRFQTSQDVQPPGDVQGLAVVDLLNGSLRITWAAATDDIGVSHYRVYRSEDGVDFRPVAEVKDTVFEDSGLEYERFYVYQVVAVDHGGNEAPGVARLRASATAVPLLLSGGVSPTAGSSSTTFKYTIRYQSAGGIAPAFVRVIVDGVPQEMTLVGEADYVNGALYEYATRMAPHRRDQPHTYAFEASDGRYAAKFPVDGGLLRGPLVSGDVDAEGGSVGLASFAKNVPVGGASVALAGILVAAAAVALAIRRKKEGSQ